MNKQAGKGFLIARGSIDVISSIPYLNDALDSVYDIKFRAIVKSDDKFEKEPKEKDVVSFEKIKTMTLVSRFDVKPVTLVYGSRACVQQNMNKRIVTQYADGRVKSLRIELIPNGPTLGRMGYWSIGFEPYVDVTSHLHPGIGSDWYPTENGIHHMFQSVSGPANERLVLNYRPLVQHGRAFNFMDLNNNYGEVAIRFDSYARDTYVRFRPDEFSCQILISGLIELRTSASISVQTYGGNDYEQVVFDKLLGVDGYIQSNTYSKDYILSGSYEYTDTKLTGKITSIRKNENPV